MKRLMSLRVGAVVGAVLLLTAPVAFGATRTFDYNNDPSSHDPYGWPDADEVNRTPPPIFNMPAYSTQTVGFIGADGTGFGHGGAGDNGNDTFLTHWFYYAPTVETDNNSQEIRFSWADKTDDTSWVRIITAAASGVTPIFPNPTVDIGDGSSIKMKFLVYLEKDDGGGGMVENTAGQLEVALVLRETGNALPLGEDGGATTGNLEFVGVDASQTNGTTSPYTPIGGTALTSSGGALTDWQGYAWYEVEWAFGSDNTKVTVTVDGGTPQTLDIAGCINGDGILSAADDRATLAGLAIRKPALDDDTMKIFLDVDDIVIYSPGTDPPILLDAGLAAFDTSVRVGFIDGITPADNVKLYIDYISDGLGNPVVVATAEHGVGGVDLTDGQHTFDLASLGAWLRVGDEVSASQTVASVESPRCVAITVTAGRLIDDFEATIANGGTADPPVDDYEIWYAIMGANWFGTIDGATLDGSQALRIGDGGYMNGIYRIYASVIPADGTYHLTADMHVSEDPAQPNSIRAYEMGVIVNGQHRTSGTCHNQAIHAVDLTQPGNAVASYFGLTSGDDTSLPTQNIATNAFYAETGDTLLIVFSTNVHTAWENVAFLDGPDGIPGTCDDRLDMVDGCEVAYYDEFWNECYSSQPNAQMTGDVTESRANTSAVWGSYPAVASIQVDNISLMTECVPSCAIVPPVTISGVLVAGQTSVTVTCVDPSPNAVTVYDLDSATPTTPIGQLTSGFAGTGTEVVPVTPLVSGHAIVATQSIWLGICGMYEACMPAGGPIVDSCTQISAVSVSPIGLDAGSTNVTVEGVDPSAEVVTVYVNDVAVAPPIPPLVKGDVVKATQTISGIEGCLPATGVMVGSGGNSSIMLCVGIRETNPSGAIGEDGGLASSSIEWLGATTAGGAPPGGVQIVPSNDWQTVTFDPTSDPIVSFNLGDGAFADAKGVLEHLAISADPASPDVGPYTLYVDNITSGGVNFGSFETYAEGTEVIFRAPGLSGTSGPHLSGGSSAVVVTSTGDGSTNSNRIQWRFTDEASSHWVRVVTQDTANVPNPIVSLTQPITFRVKLAPAPVMYNLTASVVGGNGSVAPTSGTYVENTDVDLLATPDPGFQVKAWTGTDNDSLKTNENTVTMTGNKVVTVEFEAEPPLCNDPVQDTDGDGDVDLVDFGVFSQCFNGPNRAYGVSFPADLLAKCGCIDQDGDDDVDLTDFSVFASCFNGPNRAPAAGCP
ncbi:MAG: hypothetical protein JXA69_12255 [Phycisphaerae bacterium]|nr:hypothetical protein [Phycisphaerae bacterium]